MEASIKIDVLKALPLFLPEQCSPFTASLLAWQPSEVSKARKHEITLHSLAEAYSTLAERTLEYNAAKALYQRRLERFGVWQEYGAYRTESALEDALTTLGGMMRSCSDSDQALMRSGTMPDTIVARSAWFWFAREYGHRAIGEGDIAVPRFADNPATAFVCAVQRPEIRSYDAEFGKKHRLSLKARIVTPLWTAYQKAVREQELAHSSILRNIAILRKELCGFTATWAERSSISHAEDVWNMSIDEVVRLPEP